jgi:tetratricopeptide (TPR) repeat protein
VAARRSTNAVVAIGDARQAWTWRHHGRPSFHGYSRVLVETGMPQFKYHAFISYSHADRAWGDWLHKALETYAIPSRLVGRTTAAGVVPKSLAPVFRDRDELPSATDLNAKVAEALAQSANLVVICSPRSAASRWVNEEILGFKRLGRADRVFCLIVDGEPNASDSPGHAEEECFAPALRFTLDADGQPTAQRTEPIAADARAGKDGKANAKLKLISGLLGVGYDELRQRELQRRNRRMVLVTALALAVMTVTTALAISAVNARRSADVAREAAERRQKQAEGLVEFMLGDLSDKLDGVHRLDIMQSVDDKAMEYFASLPTADVTDAALAQRVNALEKIGSVRMNQGQTPAALQAYRAASALAAQLVSHAPGDVARNAAYAESLTWVGNAYWFQGDLEHALKNFEAARASLLKAVAAEPGDSDLAAKLATADNNAGHVLEARGKFAGAKLHYDAMLQIFTQLHAKQPANTDWLSDQGDAWNNLGKLALEQGRPDEAIASYRQDNRIKSELAARDPASHEAQENLLISNAILGRTLALRGDTDAALKFVAAAVASAQSLIAFDPSNAGWQDDFALYSQQLGGLLRQHGQLGDAAKADADALRVLESLVAKDPTNSGWQQDLAQAQLESARLQLALRDPATAQAQATRALASVRQLRAKSSDDRGLVLMAAQAGTVLGQAAAQHGDPATAKRHWQQALDTIAPSARSGDDPNFLAAWAGALMLLDQPDAARPIVARLAGMGYRATDFVALAASKQMDYPADAKGARRVADMAN